MIQSLHRVQRRFLSLYAITAVLTLLAFAGDAIDATPIDTLLRTTGPWLSGFCLVLVSACLIFCLTPAGALKIGGQHATPELPLPMWLAAVYAVATANSFVIWSAAEPIFHFIDNPLYQAGFPGPERASASALALTFSHWGTLSVAALGGFCIALSRLTNRRWRRAGQPAPTAYRSTPKHPLHVGPPQPVGPRHHVGAQRHDDRRWRVGRFSDLTRAILVSIAALCLIGSVSLLAEHLGQLTEATYGPLSVAISGDDGSAQLDLELSIPTGYLITVVAVSAALICGLLCYPHAGFALLGAIALVLGCIFLAMLMFMHSGVTTDEQSASAFSWVAGKDFYRAIDLALAGDIQIGLIDWQQVWSAHYARAWLLSAPVYALVLVHLSRGRRSRHLLLTLFATNLLVTVAWLWTYSTASLALAASDPQFVTRAMIRPGAVGGQVISRLGEMTAVTQKLDGLLAAIVLIHWFAAFAVLIYGATRFASCFKPPVKFRAFAVTSLLLGLLCMVLAVNPGLNHHALRLAAVITPVVAVVVLIQVVRKISTRTEQTR